MNEIVEAAEGPQIEPLPAPSRGPGLAATGASGPDLYPAQPPRRIGGALRAPFRLLRFLVRRAIYVVVRLIRAVWRYPIVALLLVLGAYLGDRAYEDYGVAAPSSPPVPRYELAEAIPPPDSVLGYLKAQQSFDAQAMWDNLSALAQSQNLQQGNTLPAMQQTQQTLRLQGFSFGESTYVGGYRLANGRAYYFYVTKVTLSGRTAEVYQTFFVDTDGKILLVNAPQLQSQQ